MSDSGFSSPPAELPPHDEIEQCLRRVTKAGLKDPEFSANKARAATEEELGLVQGFLKEATWKSRSKEIISAVVDEANNAPSSPQKPTKVEPKPKAKPAAKAGTKRKGDGSQPQKSKPRKKARKEESDDELSEPSLSEGEAVSEVSDESHFEEEEKPKSKDKAKPQQRTPVKRAASKKATLRDVVDSEDSEAGLGAGNSPPPGTTKDGLIEDKSITKASRSGSELSGPPETEEDVAETNGKPTIPEDDDSDMSILIDEPPKPKRQKKLATESKSKPKSIPKAAKPVKAKAEDSPDEAEIKRLQGWLVKCGIRKLWHRELAKCNTAKEKIKHLKKMLDDAGMSGRYSNEKAQQIKESRELAAELEAVQEFSGMWGQGDDGSEEERKARPKRGKSVSAPVENEEDESEEDVKPKKRLPKGLVDFGDSGDEGSD